RWIMWHSRTVTQPVSSTLYGARFLTGEVGGSVTHQCFYSITPANKHDRKYWCKISGKGVCYTIISTTGYTSKDYAGRVSLEDTPQNGTFRVMMTELKKSDTGTYRCGIGVTNRDLYVTLNLTVLAGRRLAGERGGSVLPAPRLAGTSSPTCSLHPAQEAKISQRHSRRVAVLLVQVEGGELLARPGKRDLHGGDEPHLCNLPEQNLPSREVSSWPRFSLTLTWWFMTCLPRFPRVVHSSRVENTSRRRQ
uniref:Immunoglobulin domain-containing protein n=1 Tax=Athene cunicularia TaxID=194338 RepID=A0A663MDH1_ATHCN